MNLTFLCAYHRRWLADNPDEALECCAKSCENGWLLYQHAHFEKALPYVGCAFETAEILLSSRAVSRVYALEWYLHSLAGFVHTLLKLRRIDTCKDVYLNAIARLKTELKFVKPDDAENRALLDAQISRLLDELKQLESWGEAYTVHPYASAQNEWSMTVH